MLRLKELREKLNISQKTIAEYLGVNRTTYTKYETEKSEPDIQTLIKLSKYFNVTVDYLLGKDTPASSDENDEKRELLNRIAQMDDDQLRQLSDYADYLIDKKKN